MPEKTELQKFQGKFSQLKKDELAKKEAGEPYIAEFEFINPAELTEEDCRIYEKHRAGLLTLEKQGEFSLYCEKVAAEAIAKKVPVIEDTRGSRANFMALIRREIVESEVDKKVLSKKNNNKKNHQ